MGKARAPSCHRCGYDLSGVIASWEVVGVCFLLLRQSTRLARVRVWHLVRIWAYSVVLVPIVFAVWAVFRPVAVPRLINLPEALARGMAPVWLWIETGALVSAGAWWWWATSRYLRMRHALAMALLLTLAAGLVCLVGLIGAIGVASEMRWL